MSLTAKASKRAILAFSVTQTLSFCVLRNTIAQNKQWTCEAESVLVLAARVGIRGVGWGGLSVPVVGCAPLRVVGTSPFAP
jgi:hypothetical protein